MHYLTLDTNTWIYLANGTEPVRLLHYIKQEVDKRNITILLPKVIIKEWETHKYKTVLKGSIKHFNDISDALDKILKLLGEKGERDEMSFLFGEDDGKDYFIDFVNNFKKKKQEVENATEENIKLIDELFKHRLTQVIEIKNDIFIKAGNFALEKKAPFKYKNSFADALIIFSFVEYVKENSIESAFFVTYNTEDFCEKIDNKKSLHTDLSPDFIESKSQFYTILGEAMNNIKTDIVSKEEIQWAKEMLEESIIANLDYCEICAVNNDHVNEIYFGIFRPLIDERTDEDNYNPLQMEFQFVNELKKYTPINKYKKIEVGYCSWCNTEHFKCVQCGSVNSMQEDDYDNRKECDDCGLPYCIDTSKANGRIRDAYTYRILEDDKICEKCGNEFSDLGDNSDLCEECENEYSYG